MATLRDISTKPTTFTYQGVRFAYSPEKGLTFRSGKVTVRMVKQRPVFDSVAVHLDDRYVGVFSKTFSTAKPDPTPKLWQVVRLGIDAWVSEWEKRTAASDAARQESIDRL